MREPCGSAMRARCFIAASTGPWSIIVQMHPPHLRATKMWKRNERLHEKIHRRVSFFSLSTSPILKMFGPPASRASDSASPYRVPAGRAQALRTPKAADASNSPAHPPPSRASPRLSIGSSSSGQELGTSTHVQCTCLRSKCLKMYCECFSNNRLCDPTRCSCVDCHNTGHHARNLAQARGSILRRNPAAFSAKIQKLHGNRRHTRGCRCARSRCVKRYCECFREGMQCTTACACVECCNGKASFTVLPNTGGDETGSANESMLESLLADLGPMPHDDETFLGAASSTLS